jgi:hypothetical protein
MDNPVPDSMKTGAGVVEYGAKVCTRLHEWFSKTSDLSFEAPVPTYYGLMSVHDLLERTSKRVAE